MGVCLGGHSGRRGRGRDPPPRASAHGPLNGSLYDATTSTRSSSPPPPLLPLRVAACPARRSVHTLSGTRGSALSSRSTTLRARGHAQPSRSPHMHMCVCTYSYLWGVLCVVKGAQRPNLKNLRTDWQDSHSAFTFRHRFSEAKVSLWMCENGAGREASRGPTRR